MKWSFEELGFLSRKVANVLTKVCGLQKGDRILVILPRVPEWWLVNVACMRTGERAYLSLVKLVNANWSRGSRIYMVCKEKVA